MVSGATRRLLYEWLARTGAGGQPDVEATLHSLDPTHELYPVLSQVDPYGDASFTQSQLQALGESP